MSGLYIEVFKGMSYDTLLPIAARLGFDGFFTNWEYASDIEKMRYYKTLGESLGLAYETSHSVIPGSNTVWLDGKEGDDFIDLLKTNIDNCEKLSVGILVVHVQPNARQNPSFETGIKRFDNLVKYAKVRGVTIAFENIGMPSFLYRTLDALQDSNVGFCYDSGHEACCTPGVRHLPRIGDRLVCTHLHDNDNRSDLHLIPYDGEIGFDRVAKDLRDCAYRGNITLELNYERYADRLLPEDYLQKCLDVAKKIRNSVSL